MTKNTPIILHIPHSSTYVPFYEGFVTAKEEIDNEINNLTDWHTEELFNLPYSKIIAPFARVFCDVERFPDDSIEVMTKSGMGMCYTHFDSGKLMRNVSSELRNKIKSLYYDHHHKRLESAVEECLSQHDKAFIIDCHSFPNIPLVRDLQKELPRPDFCIGTSDFHTPVKTAKYLYDLLTEHGYIVKLNNPYTGTMIPLKYLNADKRVHGIMIEVNRKLYLDETDNKIVKNDNFPEIRNIIKEVITIISKSY
jgi:N-formylglutamate amidohydrolase